MHVWKKSAVSYLEPPLLLFFLFSVAGWIWEVLFVALSTGQVVNRGFLRGPWLPVYGTGGLLIFQLLRGGRGWGLFFRSALLGGVVEFAASILLEAVFHARWWDYSGWLWNVDGRVCLGSTAAFGIAGWGLVRFLGPALERSVECLPSQVRGAVCRTLCALFALDMAIALVMPHVGAGISFPV